MRTRLHARRHAQVCSAAAQRLQALAEGPGPALPVAAPCSPRVARPQSPAAELGPALRGAWGSRRLGARALCRAWRAAGVVVPAGSTRGTGWQGPWCTETSAEGQAPPGVPAGPAGQGEAEAPSGEHGWCPTPSLPLRAHGVHAWEHVCASARAGRAAHPTATTSTRWAQAEVRFGVVEARWWR